MPIPNEVFTASANAAVPGGNFVKPLVIGLLALLAARKFGGGSGNGKERPDFSLPEATEKPQGPAQDVRADETPGTVSEGLGELADQFRKSGLGEAIDTWIKPGANKNVKANDVSGALGGDVVDELTHRTGLSREQVLDGLAQALPGVVDKLTPEGRLPTRQDLFRLMS